MTGFRMQIIRAQNRTGIIIFRGRSIPVEKMAADFYESHHMWPELRAKGPMRQYLAVYRAYSFLLERFQYPENTTFPSLPAERQKLFKKVLTGLIARGLQSGLIQYRDPDKVQMDDINPAKSAARSLVESRIAMDLNINGKVK